MSPPPIVQLVGGPPGDTNLVALSINSYLGPAQGTLIGVFPTTLNGGAAIFPTTIFSSPGTYTLKASDIADNATGISPPIVIAANSSTQAPVITSAPGASFTIGSFGSFTVTATGTPTPTLSESGTLPNGVNFVDNANGTGTLSGTPAAGSNPSYTFNLNASNGTLPNASQGFMLTVGTGTSAPSITSGPSTAFTIGSLGSFAVTTAGNPAVTNITSTGSLPNGITFTDTGNTATFAGTPLAGSVGTYNVTLDASNGTLPDATQAFTIFVSLANSGLNLAPSANPVLSTQTITLTATTIPTHSGVYPTGSVTFSTAAGPLAGVTLSSTGTATLQVLASNLIVGGVHNSVVTVTYAGDNTFLPTSTSYVQTVYESPAITSANNASFTLGQNGSFFITTTGFPTPTVTEAGRLPSGVALMSTTDPATYVLSGTPALGTTGPYPITLTAHNGNGAGFPPDVTQSFTLAVNGSPTTTTLIATGPNPALPTQATSLQATVSGGVPDGGTVTLEDASDGNAIIGGGILSGGVANMFVPAGLLSAGIHNIFAVYAGDSNFLSSVSGPVTQSVYQAPAITSANGATFTVGQNGSFMITGTGFPIPTVTETGALPDGVTLMPTAVPGTYVLSGTPAAGSVEFYSIVLTAHNGNADGFPPDFTQDFTLTLNGLLTTTTLIATGPNPALPTQATSFQATVSGGVPDGDTVTLEDASDGNAIIGGGILSGGVANMFVPAGLLSAGIHNIFAVYAGDSNFLSSFSSPVIQSVITMAPTVNSVVINGDNPNGLSTVGTFGAQRSMVEDIVYTFSLPVGIPDANAAFTISAAGEFGGTVPASLFATAVPGSNSTQWAISLTGAASGVLGSIANGEYSITLNPTAVFTLPDGTTRLPQAAARTDTFFRLFGDYNGDRVVNAADNLKFKNAINGVYNPIFDSNADGTINAADNLVFKKDLSIGYAGDNTFNPTI